MGGSDDENIAWCSDVLWTHWQRGTVFDPAEGRVWPNSRADGYAIQALLEGRSRKPLFGWKIAATSTAGQQHIRVDGPMAGRLLSERVHESGVTIDLAGNRMRVAEPEFAFRFGCDLPPREIAWTVDEAVDAVATLHPALEIPDSRYADFTTVGEAKLIADNACAHEFVVGAAAATDWKALELAGHQVRATVAGRYDRAGEGANVLGDPRVALAWLVNEITGMGITIKADQVVTSGTCMVPLEIQPGDSVRADFGVLGHVDVEFSDQS